MIINTVDFLITSFLLVNAINKEGHSMPISAFKSTVARVIVYTALHPNGMGQYAYVSTFGYLF
ncbi:MAG: hypothetical protein AB8U44_02690 [Aaplasma endosymbiont of Hyalomma asiaticum]